MKRLDYTTAFLRAIASPKMKKPDIAVIYILLLTRTTHADIEKINREIMIRWSHSGLQDIKRMAWQEVERRNLGDPRDKNL